MSQKIKQLSKVIGRTFMALSVCGNGAYAKTSESRVRTVSVNQVIRHPALDVTYQGVVDRLRERGYRSGENLILNYEQAQGNVVLSSQISQKFVSKGADVLVGVGTTSSQSLVNASGNKIPVVFTTVTDPVGSGIVESLKGSKKSVTGVSNMTDMKEQLLFMKKIIPDLKTVGVIFNPGEDNSVKLVKTLEDKAKETGLRIVASPANKTIEVPTAARFLVGKADVMFVTNDNTALSAFDAIAKTGLEQRIPVFVSDVDIVSQGALGALGPDQYEVGRQTGDMVADILEGKKAGEIPTGFPTKNSLYLNESLAKTLGISFAPDLKKQATKIL